MFSVWYTVGLFVLSTTLAFLDFQVEGKYGWAAKLPCWRPKEGSRAARIYTKIVGDGKPLTGYHLAFNGVVIATLHFPFFAKTSWTAVRELEVISSFLLVSVLEDFLWFVWNPAYGVKRFNSCNPDIWWMREWICGVIPKCYIKGIVWSAIFAGGAAFLGDPSIFAKWGVALGVLAALTFCSCLLVQLRNRLLGIGQD